MRKRENKIPILISICLLVSLLIPVHYSRSEDVQELNQLISDKKRIIEELNEQQQQYQQQIKEKQQQAVSLSNEVSILDNKIASRTLGIEATNLQIENLELEIKAVNLEINKKERELDINKERVKGSLQELYQAEENNDYLKILLMYDNLSDFFEEMNRLRSLNSDLNTKIEQLAESQQWLAQRNADLVQSKSELESLREKLIIENEKLKNEQNTKLVFLSRTENDERKFQILLAELKQEQEEANALISQYEQQARRLLAEKQGYQLGEDEILIWPTPSQYITAYFHDPDYPFRRVFEHPGIDIRAGQGTPIKAAASGYVAVAKDNGYGYSYIMLVHSNGLSTVYGHVSRIDVKTGDFVLQGDIIGLSGGMPGTLGAGRLTTGSHLHFEVRVNGTPVNPLVYLGNN